MDKPRIRFMCLAVVAAGGLGASARADITMNFDAPVLTGSTAAPGVWYTDRAVPFGFDSPSILNQDNRLEESIRAGGAQSDPSMAFYNTQGRAYDLEAGTQSMSIQLYVPKDWGTTSGDRRFAGFWGVGVDSSNNITSYPIVEFANIGGVGEFRVYDSNTGVWTDTALPGGIAYDQFHTLSIALQGSDITYSVDGFSLGSYDSAGTVSLSSVILQGYNTPGGVNYDIFWDNLHTSTQAVPEPASVVSAVLGLAGMGLVALRRRRKAVA